MVVASISNCDSKVLKKENVNKKMKVKSKKTGLARTAPNSVKHLSTPTKKKKKENKIDASQKLITSFFTPQKRKIRTPGYAYNSLHHKRIISNYQSVLFTPRKKRNIEITPEIRARIERNRLRALQIQEVDRLLQQCQEQNRSSSEFKSTFTCASNFVTTQDVAKGLAYCKQRDRSCANDSDKTIEVTNPVL